MRAALPSHRAPTATADASRRLRRILDTPGLPVTAPPRTRYERAILAAWDGDESAAARALPAEKRTAIAAARRRNDGALRSGETSRWFELLFDRLPRPVLVATSRGLVWNARFGELVAAERSRAVAGTVQRSLRLSARRRFSLLLEHAANLRKRRLLVALGGCAFDAAVVRFEDADSTAIYLSPVALDLSALPGLAGTVALYKASGLPHKQIALLCRTSKSRIDHLSSAYRVALLALRRSSCLAPAP